jgi:hypothetical protein
MTTGNYAWDKMRVAVIQDPGLRQEIEWLMLQSVSTYNPSDRGIRFIIGTIGEWLLAFVAYAAGVFTLPDGHNADGHDLRAVLASSDARWSVKSSYTRGGNFGTSNGLGAGAGMGMTAPTVFWSPELPGLVYVDPIIHSYVKSAEVAKGGQVQLSKSIVLEHALKNPECVIECKIPENPKTATRDPGFEAVKMLVSNGTFPRLQKMIIDSAPKQQVNIVDQIVELRNLRDSGVLSLEAFESAIKKVTS